MIHALLGGILRIRMKPVLRENAREVIRASDFIAGQGDARHS
jgi:hypothetical protein